MVCGQTAYDNGEFISQIWPFDDRGPNGSRDYPDEERYANNAADILEIRVRQTDEGIAYRVALNTMVEPDAAIVAIGIDTGDATDTDWGHGLGDLGAAVDHVLVTWGEGAMLDGVPLPEEAYSVDVARNQLEVDIALDPGGETWRHYAVSGLHDGDGGFRDTNDDESTPPVYNVGFRTEEDEPKSGLGNWRAQQQASALSNRDISALGADIDFKRLAAGAIDRDVPQQGFFNRVYGSRFDLGAGYDADNEIYRTRVQPYSIYIPESYEPDEPASFLLLLHGLGQNHNTFTTWAAGMVEELGEQRDAIVLMPLGRGPSGWWKDEAELDAFEAWADVNANYNLDFDRVTISGYSMGGYGTYRLSSLYPDLFARAFPVVGPPGEAISGGPLMGNNPVYGREPTGTQYSDNPQNTLRITENLRHVPMLLWAGVPDELVPYPGVRNYRRRLADHGYRHRLDTFPTDHLLPGLVVDEWGPGKEFLGDARVERQPARVTYRAVPYFWNEEFGLVSHGAYWVQEIELAEDASDSLAIHEEVPDVVQPDGLVDAVALTHGYGDPTSEEFKTAGTEPLPHTREGTEWSKPTESRPPENAIEVTLDEVTGVTLYVDEVDVDPTKPLTVRVDSTHQAEITLVSGAGTATVEVGRGWSTTTVILCDPGGKDPQASQTGPDYPEQKGGETDTTMPVRNTSTNELSDLKTEIEKTLN